MRFLIETCPTRKQIHPKCEGGRGGQRMSVALKGGKVLKVTIPMGAKPGQLMSVKVREGDTMYFGVWFSSGW